ncbi:SDR family oxidoreductase [Microbacterium sp. zg.Y1090]|uniref:SDR family NAD(P)-dependent oxidoreductase n=1 Tax=Microbacterium TaxID=33882 RepID=UPI00214B0335|nr:MULTISPECIES: SDR family oxidoreductase [unclassified Microbacterium]MCR2813303.1 SDR family oxidoreductase [Microbacterium sp. zg.Y1084]MCR2819863.1 SDR family oxidoreductase [Microbacterium sp. zg.Y1090]MDL5487974.1 SDR family oxidoreductase [Microbacterium sp. zg-Y1211]WIM28580.1 SDR family oxidoreductase [Microbacterium sp. zg-Y1090]
MNARPHTIVTGGASGIGAAVVAELLRRGHRVTVFDLSADAHPGAFAASVDVTDETAVSAAVQAAIERGGTVTGVVACHGIRGAFVPALEMDLAAMRRLYDVHVVGTVAVCREVVRRLHGAPGSIVLLSSTTAYRGWANQIDYGTAKAAVRQLAENLAVEWAPLRVRVNAVAPGHTLTPMVEDLIAGGYDISTVERRTPLGRLAQPDEMAGAIVHLLEDATFVTGQCLAVDGGWTAVGK